MAAILKGPAKCMRGLYSVPLPVSKAIKVVRIYILVLKVHHTPIMQNFTPALWRVNQTNC